MAANRQFQLYNAATISGTPTAQTCNNLGQSMNPVAVLVVTIGSAPTGTSPTLKFTLGGSVDGTNYAAIDSTPTYNAAGTYRYQFNANVLEPLLNLLPVLTGTTPSFTNVTATLLLTSPDS